jgi:hypothetical protein
MDLSAGQFSQKFLMFSDDYLFNSDYFAGRIGYRPYSFIDTEYLISFVDIKNVKHVSKQPCSLFFRIHNPSFSISNSTSCLSWESPIIIMVTRHLWHYSIII